MTAPPRDPSIATRPWSQWLTMPMCRRLHRDLVGEDPELVLDLDLGRPVDAENWPRLVAPRIYAALDDDGLVYVGQTTTSLSTRVRRHFGSLRTADERDKAERWVGVVSAAFLDLAAGDLDDLERSAADWVLADRHRTGRRHPRSSPAGPQIRPRPHLNGREGPGPRPPPASRAPN